MGKRKRIDKKYEKVVPGKDSKIVTGIPTIDEFMKDGFPRGMIIAPIGNNKSSFFRNLPKEGDIITLEMPQSYYEGKWREHLSKHKS